MRRIAAAFVGLAMLACWPVVGLAEGKPEAASLYDLPFHWVDDAGRDVSLSDWGGSRVLLTFFYANCTRVCPRTMQILKKIQKKLDEQSVSAEFVLITIDPLSDTVAALARLRSNRNLPANWHLLRAEPGETNRFTAALGFANWPHDVDQLMHDFRIYELDESGRVSRTLEWNDGVDDLFD